jgi:sporulation protein YlmC with PRC-barrel domain
MNTLAHEIYDILKAELSEITSKMILEEKCKKIGKCSDSIIREDLRHLVPLILSPVLLFGGEKKAKVIKEKLTILSEPFKEAV